MRVEGQRRGSKEKIEIFVQNTAKDLRVKCGKVEVHYSIAWRRLANNADPALAEKGNVEEDLYHELDLK